MFSADHEYVCFVSCRDYEVFGACFDLSFPGTHVIIFSVIAQCFSVAAML